MQIKKETLLTALEAVKPGLATKEVIEQTTSFAFRNGYVTTYNDEISISHPIPGLEIEGAIKADKLYSLLAKIKKEEIEITITDNQLLLTAGRTKAGIPIEAEIKLPVEEIGKIDRWKPLDASFCKALAFSASACSKDMSRPLLTCVHVRKDGFMEASDAYKIIQYNTKKELPVTKFLIPASTASLVIKFAPTKIAEGTGWVHFKTEKGTIISCRVFEGEYPDTSSVIQIKDSVQITLPSTIEEILERAIVFAKRDHTLDETIAVTITNNRFKMKSESDGGGWFEEETNIKYNETPIEFSITPYLLQGILKESLNCEFTSSRLKFTGESWVYVLCLKG